MCQALRAGFAYMSRQMRIGTQAGIGVSLEQTAVGIDRDVRLDGLFQHLMQSTHIAAGNKQSPARAMPQRYGRGLRRAVHVGGRFVRHFQGLQRHTSALEQQFHPLVQIAAAAVSTVFVVIIRYAFPLGFEILRRNARRQRRVQEVIHFAVPPSQRCGLKTGSRRLTGKGQQDQHGRAYIPVCV